MSTINRDSWSVRVINGLRADGTEAPTPAAPKRRLRNHKLTEADVAAIRRIRRETGVTQATLGAAFDISQPQVQRILAHAQWK